MKDEDDWDFGARIAKIGVAVEKIWRKEVIEIYFEFLENV
jgi:hypothetical protein